jgi:phage terminase small subunit
MAALANARRERFAQELAKGASQLEAYRLAGYKPDDGAAARLSVNVRVRARIAELQARAADGAVVTILDIARQLDEDRLFARELESPAAAISATMGKAKVLGLLTDKVEHSGEVHVDGAELLQRVREEVRDIFGDRAATGAFDGGGGLPR